MRIKDENRAAPPAPSEIKAELREIKALGGRPDMARAAFSRMEKLIEAADPAAISEHKPLFADALSAFLPKKRKALEEAMGRRISRASAPKASAAARPESPEKGFAERIKAMLSGGVGAEEAFDQFSDEIMIAGTQALKNIRAQLYETADRFPSKMRSELRRMLSERVGDDPRLAEREKAASGGAGAAQATAAESLGGALEKAVALLKKPDGTGAAYEIIERLLALIDPKTLADSAGRIEEIANRFMPARRKKLLDALNEKIKSPGAAAGDRRGGAAKSALSEIEKLLGRPDAIQDAYRALDRAIDELPVDEIIANQKAFEAAAYSFFPKKRRELLNKISAVSSGGRHEAEFPGYEETLNRIRSGAMKRFDPEKSYSLLCDMIMACPDRALEEFAPDIMEISLYLPGRLRKETSSLINKRLGPAQEPEELEDEIVADSKPDVPAQPSAAPPESEEMVEETGSIAGAPGVFEEIAVAPEPPEDSYHLLDGLIEEAKPYERMAHIQAGRFDFTEHAVSRAGQRGITYDAIDMAMQYGRQESSRGAVYYVIGRAEVDEYKTTEPEIINFEGVHVVCSSDDGSILTVFKNKDLTALKHGKKQVARTRIKRTRRV